jgi:hypothetical protein
MAIQRNSDAIVLTDDRREVANKKQLLVRIPPAAKEADDASLRIIAIYPFKARSI